MDAVSRIISALVSLAAYVVGYFRGRDNSEIERLKEEKEAMKNAKALRDKLAHDELYRNRVRDRFKRR